MVPDATQAPSPVAGILAAAKKRSEASGWHGIMMPEPRRKKHPGENPKAVARRSPPLILESSFT
jgi:hypothetical protein